MTPAQRDVARARLLRRQGRTYAEIRAELGVGVSDDALRGWLRGIPRPPQTRRSRGDSRLRAECRRLRAHGLTITQISARTGAAAGSVSVWVSGVRPPRGAAALRAHAHAAARRAAGDRLRYRAEQRRERVRVAAAADFGDVERRDLFVAGVALYWAEGAKSKPWRPDGRVRFINSDASVVALFLRWLDLLGVPERDRSYRLSIHETADIDSQQTWWAQRLALPDTCFARASVKRHNPKTVRHNTSSEYHGCLVVEVRGSWRLYYSIEGWWHVLSRAESAAELPASGVDSSAPIPGCSVGRGDVTLNDGTT